MLYDRMLLDDELEQAFATFQAGVNIVLLSDSCHSGTVFRSMFEPAQLQYAERKAAFYQGLVSSPGPLDGTRGFPMPLVTGSRDGGNDEALEEQRVLFARSAATFSTKLKLGRGWKPATGYVSIFDRFPALESRVRTSTLTPQRVPRRGPRAGRTGGDRSAPEPVATRNMPLGINTAVVTKHAARYAAIQESARARDTVQANGLSISGCEDSQLSQEVGGHGVFTTTVTEVWRDSTFTGTFEDFHRAILSRMGPTQTPVLSLWGKDPQSLVRTTPFECRG